MFVTRHGIKLLDFGLARPEVDHTLDSAVDLTGSGILLGTPRYMAPEQVTGQPVDARTDLFAAGAILFEMLAGRPAFAGRSVLEILNAMIDAGSSGVFRMREFLITPVAAAENAFVSSYPKYVTTPMLPACPAKEII